MSKANKNSDDIILSADFDDPQMKALIDEYYRYINYLTIGFQNSPMERDDLIQEGMI